LLNTVIFNESDRDLLLDRKNDHTSKWAKLPLTPCYKIRLVLWQKQIPYSMYDLYIYHCANFGEMIMNFDTCT